jgi:hypothetical protein
VTFKTPASRPRLIRIHNVGQFTAAVAFQMPETLPETADELNALLEAARAEVHVYEAQHAAGRELSPEDIASLRALVGDNGHIDTITAARDAAVAAEATHTEELSGLLARAAATGQPLENATDVPGDPDETPEGDAPEGGEAPEGDAPEGDAPEGGEAPQAVAASGQPTDGAGRPVTFAGTGAGGQTPPPATPREPGWEMHPGAPGYTQGMGRVGFRDIALSLDRIRPGSRSAVRPNRPAKKMDGVEFARQVVSTLSRDVDIVEDSHALVAAINAATASRNLSEPVFNERGSLTAAGGWCAPSEQLYDFCDVPDATDLVSLPEITINRGGIRWPREPDMSGIFEDFEWFFTEAQLEATDVDGNPTAIKTCVEIPCPDQFDEIRLNAVGWCVESGILQEQGWPELSEWFMRNLTQEHLRALSRRTILDVVAGSGAAIVIPPASVLGSVASVLNSLAIVATNIRLKRGLARTATIEGIAPSWFHEVLRADLAMREGTDVFAVTDAAINGWLSARNIALQFVGDWQTRSAGLPGNLATLKWPTTVDVVLYPAGTWFRSMSNVIELGVMYPKEQLQVNRFTRMFTEDAIAVGKRCGESVLVRVPLDVNGAVGIRDTASNA